MARSSRAVALARREWVFLAWLAIGLIGRAILLRTAWGELNSDEATGVLMASRAAHGQFFSLFWGGNYGGTLVTWIEAPLVAVFGLHLVIFRCVDVALALVATVLLRLVAGRLLSRRAALAAAVLFWLGPPAWFEFGMHEYVWWVPGMCVALGAVLCCLRWNERRVDAGLWLIGLLIGVAFWLFLPLMALVAPGFVGVAWALRRRPGALIKLIALIPVGALPWLYATVAHGFATIKRTSVAAEPIDHRFADAIIHVLPASIVSDSSLQPSAHVLDGLGVTIMAAAGLFVLWQAYRRRWLLALAVSPVLLWPFIVAASGILVTVQSYRYAFIVVPPLAIFVAYLADQVRLAVLAPVAVAVVTAVGASQATGDFATVSNFPAGMAKLSSYLVAHDRTHVFAGYWVSYVLSVESDQAVTASPTSLVRDQRYQHLAETAPRTTYVFDAGLGLDHQMTTWSDVHHMGTRIAVGGYAVWELPTHVPRKDIPLVGNF